MSAKIDVTRLCKGKSELAFCKDSSFLSCFAMLPGDTSGADSRRDSTTATLLNWERYRPTGCFGKTVRTVHFRTKAGRRPLKFSFGQTWSPLYWDKKTEELVVASCEDATLVQSQDGVRALTVAAEDLRVRDYVANKVLVSEEEEQGGLKKPPNSSLMAMMGRL